MTIDQIIQLTHAGFTAEQVTALAPMIAPVAPAAPEAPAAPVAPAAPEAPAAPVAPVAPAPAPAPDFDSIKNQLDMIQQALNRFAVNVSNAPNEHITAADVAADIINPRKKK